MSLPFFTFKEPNESSKMYGYDYWLRYVKYANLPPLSKPPCEASPNCSGGCNYLSFEQLNVIFEEEPGWARYAGQPAEVILTRSFVVDPAGQCQPRPTDLPELKDMFSPEPDL